MIVLWALAFTLSSSAAIMFYRSLDEANSWASALALVFGLNLSLVSALAFAGLALIEMGVV